MQQGNAKNAKRFSLSIHPTRSAVKARTAKYWSENSTDEFSAFMNIDTIGNMPQFDGIDIFSGFYKQKHLLLLDISDDLLRYFAAKAANIYEHRLPDNIVIPMRGNAYDSEASPYLRSLLYAYIRKNVCISNYNQVRDALFRCLSLFSLEGNELHRGHSSAVRSVAQMCATIAPGAMESAAMCAALLYVEQSQIFLG